MHRTSGLIGIGALFFFACENTGTTAKSTAQGPDWLQVRIAQYQNEPVGNPPRSVWQYRYQNKDVYLIPAQCCDQYDSLFEAEDKFLCAPSGGIAGKGDGKCSDFNEVRTGEKLIWKDERGK